MAGRVPVVLQGSVVDPDLAQQALDDGVADLVEMTRAQIADPDVVSGVREGRTPRPCVLCNQTCLVRDPRNPIVTCIGNPSAGHETVDPEPTRGTDLGSALVVGAGPAGLEAARVLALHGFRVALCDKRDRPGGMMRTAAAGFGRARLANLVDWLEDECRRLGVDIRTGVEVTAADVGAAEDSVVVLAAGSSPVRHRVRRVRVCRPPRPRRCWPAVRSSRDRCWCSTRSAGRSQSRWQRGWRSGASGVDRDPDQIVGSRLGPTGDLVGANARVQRAGIVRHLASVPVSAGREKQCCATGSRTSRRGFRVRCWWTARTRCRTT
ncbi:NAD(P)-binding protein [Prescottella defluvii]|nr:NAD(P)-binding protein [Prescottella defluvii]